MADIDLFGVSFENVKGFKLPDGEGGVAEFVSLPAGKLTDAEYADLINKLHGGM